MIQEINERPLYPNEKVRASPAALWIENVFWYPDVAGTLLGAAGSVGSWGNKTIYLALEMRSVTVYFRS